MPYLLGATGGLPESNAPSFFGFGKSGHPPIVFEIPQVAEGCDNAAGH